MPIFVTTAPYYRSHLREPRGFGLWAFEMGDKLFCTTALYGEAKRKALAAAKEENARRQKTREAGIVTIAVLP